MAGSRLPRLGTIFGRVTALLRAGAMKRKDKPVWYEVYQVFPPREEPSYDNIRPVVPIKDIFYPEDKIRALFHQKMYRKLPAENLANDTSIDITRTVINVSYEILRENASLTEEEAVDKAIEKLRVDGLLGPLKGPTSKRSTFIKDPSKSTPPPPPPRFLRGKHVKSGIIETSPEETEKSDEVEITNENRDIKNVVDKQVDVSPILKQD